jgi:RNA polymerase sporulation-specific sigma factor
LFGIFLVQSLNLLKPVSGIEISLIDALRIGKRRRHRHHSVQAQSLKKSKNSLTSWTAEKKKFIAGRFSLDLKKEKTQREIAKELGISRSYVSRIEKRALMKVFHEFYREKKELFPNLEYKKTAKLS